MPMTCDMSMQRSILFDLKDEIVPPTNETVTQVFARLSAYRDSMDGPQVSCISFYVVPLIHHEFISILQSLAMAGPMSD